MALESARSLRLRLLLWVLLTTLSTWGLAAFFTYRQAKREVQELMDGQMAKTARLLLAQARTDVDHLTLLPQNMAGLRGAEKSRHELALEYAIMRSDGKVLLKSPNAPELGIAEPLGYSEIRHSLQTWRSLHASSDSGLHVHIAHTLQARNKEALEIARKTVRPLAFLLPLMVLLIWLAVRRGLEPLNRLALGVAARSPANLSALNPEDAPREAMPLVRALNRLLERLARALENERCFTADAAHELRTPLAALKVQAEVALASPAGKEQRHALAQVISGANRMTHLVDQLLRLARLDPLQQLPATASVDLAALARQVCAEIRLADHDHALYCEASDAPIEINGSSDLLAVALRNLLDNALRHSGKGAEVLVRAAERDGTKCLEVIDSGSGVDAKSLGRLGQRFYRSPETLSEGSGLGLAMVLRIAELHGAQLQIANRPAGGLIARLAWPGRQDA